VLTAGHTDGTDTPVSCSVKDVTSEVTLLVAQNKAADTFVTLRTSANGHSADAPVQRDSFRHRSLSSTLQTVPLALLRRLSHAMVTGLYMVGRLVLASSSQSDSAGQHIADPGVDVSPALQPVQVSAPILLAYVLAGQTAEARASNPANKSQGGGCFLRAVSHPLHRQW
jgi:hypothetical protein